jgi:Amt family ammonium transporter
MLGACSGAVAGLVCITPASGYVSPMAALLIGALAGVVCFWTSTQMKHRLGYDDSLDAFGVHGVGGTLGAILTGVFATIAVTDAGVSKGQPLGLLEGGSLLIPQTAAAIVTWIYAAAMTVVLLKIVDTVVGLRVTEEEEVQGLDYSLHGEEGYLFL